LGEWLLQNGYLDDAVWDGRSMRQFKWIEWNLQKIWVIWRYDREEDEIPDVFGEEGDSPIFVITAY
jgi:hypothetical protein